MFSGFTFGANSISEEFAGFSPLWFGFPEENSLCLLSLVFIAVHVILLVKYTKIMLAQNDKNLTSSEEVFTSMERVSSYPFDL